MSGVDEEEEEEEEDEGEGEGEGDDSDEWTESALDADSPICSLFSFDHSTNDTKSGIGAPSLVSDDAVLSDESFSERGEFEEEPKNPLLTLLCPLLLPPSSCLHPQLTSKYSLLESCSEGWL